jgi:23S rRNA (cytosine1962-C5)-methyltransferase
VNPPCVLFEDEHLLVVNKPAGWNTHAPAPYAGEGIYDWLRHREPRWANLAIIHRLDKETSGVLVFGKTPLANKSLSEQFEQRKVSKRYLLVSDRPPPKAELVVRSNIARDGDRYTSLPNGAGGEPAETKFFTCGGFFFPGAAKQSSGPDFSGALAVATSHPFQTRSQQSVLQLPSASPHSPAKVGLRYCFVIAEPHTGRTHQIRVHAAANGFPILGDTLYGGTPAARVFLHALEIRLTHPATGEPVVFDTPPGFTSDARLALREALVAPVGRDSVELSGERSEASGASIFSTTLNEMLAALAPISSGATARRNLTAPPATAFRLIHGAADGWPGWQVERLGDFLLSQSEAALTDAQATKLADCLKHLNLRGAYHKRLDRRVRDTKTQQVSPLLVLGEPAPDRFTARENGLAFELSFTEGYSYGLFLDQRDNRRRLLTGHIAAGFPLTLHPSPFTLLNCFSYTCGFSVVAAKAGAHTTSLDLSKKYLEWGRRNFALNGLDAAAHDFIYGDVFDWLRRLTKKGRQFDAALLDPPTFSQSKESGVFRAEKDYGKLVALALPLLKPDGILFASSNCATLSPEEFLATIEVMIQRAGRRIVQQHYVPQPPDFPITRDEPAYLKTVWLRVS